MQLKGQLVDKYTRCVHYAGETDIIALRFKCCDTYYPCYECHKEAGHQCIRWAKSDLQVEAVLCGVCNKKITINDYLNSDYTCKYCGSKFNPKCSLHYDLYFEPNLFQDHGKQTIEVFDSINMIL